MDTTAIETREYEVEVEAKDEPGEETNLGLAVGYAADSAGPANQSEANCKRRGRTVKSMGILVKRTGICLNTIEENNQTNATLLLYHPEIYAYTEYGTAIPTHVVDASGSSGNALSRLECE